MATAVRLHDVTSMPLLGALLRALYGTLGITGRSFCAEYVNEAPNLCLVLILHGFVEVESYADGIR